MFTNPTTPNLTDFTTFVYNQGVLPVNLPSTSEYLVWSLDYAGNIALAPPPAMPSIVYVMAIYNLGMHHLLKIAQDVTGSNFFQTQRQAYNLLSFTAGPVISSQDQATQTNLEVSEWMKTMTLSALDYLKTPWGREYLAYAQSYGPNIVGVS